MRMIRLEARLIFCIFRNFKTDQRELTFPDDSDVDLSVAVGRLCTANQLLVYSAHDVSCFQVFLGNSAEVRLFNIVDCRRFGNSVCYRCFTMVLRSENVIQAAHTNGFISLHKCCLKF